MTNKLQVQGGKYLKDLSIRQMMVMATLIHLPNEEATINNIARLMGTTKQSAKQIIDIMEKKQYLKAVPSQRDKRAVNVTITPQGEQINKICAKRINEFTADIFQEYTRKDLETLWILLRKLYHFDGIEQGSFIENMSHYMQPYEQSQEHITRNKTRKEQKDAF